LIFRNGGAVSFHTTQTSSQTERRVNIMKQRRKIYATLIVLIAALLCLSSAAIALPLPCNNYICKGVGYDDGVKQPGTETYPIAIVNDTAYSIILYFGTTCSDLAGAIETVHLMTAPHALWPTPPPYIGYDPVFEGVVSLVYIGPTNKKFDVEFAGAYNSPDWGAVGSWSCVITSPTL